MIHIDSFKDLTGWQVSMDIADIAEGSRHSTKACLNHRSYSLGSHGELVVDPIGKMLHGPVESLEARVSAQNA
jgi:hypothetical protein